MKLKKLFEYLETLRMMVVTYIAGQESNQGKKPELEDIRLLVNKDSELKKIIDEQDFSSLEKYDNVKKIITFAEENVLPIIKEMQIILISLKKDFYYIFYKKTPS